MAYQSSAAIQPKVYRLNFIVTDATLDEALVAQVETATGQTYTELMNAGTFHDKLCEVITTALNEHLVLGS